MNVSSLRSLVSFCVAALVGGALLVERTAAQSAAFDPSGAIVGVRRLTSKRAKNLGTYHLANGRWDRPGPGGRARIVSGASLYDNTCIPGSFVNAVDFTDESEMLVDSGQLPGPQNATRPWNAGTLAPSYTVDGWRWGICPSEPNQPGGILVATISWWNCLDSCLNGGDPTVVPPTQTIAVPGIPGGGTSNVCYLFNVDLANTTMQFDLQGDCDGVFDGPGEGASRDTFAYGISVVRADGAPYVNGVALAMGGDPGTQPVGDGCRTSANALGPAGFVAQSTSFLAAGRHIDASTGLANGDDFVDARGGQLPGCFSFGYFLGFLQVPYMGLHHELYGAPSSPPDVFPDYCFGNGGVAPGCTPCPCGNDAAPGASGGCLNGAGTSAVLVAAGVPSVSNDTLRFTLAAANPATFAVLVSGAQRLPSNAANPCFGLDSGVTSALLDGLRCVGSDLRRHGSRATDANGAVGVVSAPWGPPGGPAGGLLAAAGFTAGTQRQFQAFFRQNPAVLCGTGQATSQAIEATILP